MISRRLLYISAVGALLTACSGNGFQTPATTVSQQSTTGRQQNTTAPQQQARKTSRFTGEGIAHITPARGGIRPNVTCTSVTTSRGVLTAALVPAGPVDHLTLDASGCDIGIYLASTSNGQRIDHTVIHDPNQFGIFADQATNVSIDHTQIMKIGNHDSNGNFAPNGVQTGVGLYFRGATATIDHTDISLYQKNGTAFNCLFDVSGNCVQPSSVSMEHSSATGLGQVNFIAQNGIQYLDSTAPDFQHNTATNNIYNNPLDPIYDHAATGYLFLCTNVQTPQQLMNQHNAASNNDTNYYVDNVPADC